MIKIAKEDKIGIALMIILIVVVLAFVHYAESMQV